jgi:hypothetical protein
MLAMCRLNPANKIALNHNDQVKMTGIAINQLEVA